MYRGFVSWPGQLLHIRRSSYSNQQPSQFGCRCPYPCQQDMQQQNVQPFCVYEPLRNCPEYNRETQGHIYEPESYEQQHQCGNMANLFMKQQEQRRSSACQHCFMCQQQQQEQYVYGQDNSHHSANRMAVHPRWVYCITKFQALHHNIIKKT